jgi:tryptophanase
MDYVIGSSAGSPSTGLICDYRIVEEPQALRHFTARFARLD